MSEQNQKPLNHVSEDEQYTEDWTAIQTRLDEIQKKHNDLIEILEAFFGTLNPNVKEKWKKLLIQFEE